MLAEPLTASSRESSEPINIDTKQVRNYYVAENVTEKNILKYVPLT